MQKRCQQSSCVRVGECENSGPCSQFFCRDKVAKHNISSLFVRHLALLLAGTISEFLFLNYLIIFQQTLKHKILLPNPEWQISKSSFVQMHVIYPEPEAMTV